MRRQRIVNYEKAELVLEETGEDDYSDALRELRILANSDKTEEELGLKHVKVSKRTPNFRKKDKPTFFQRVKKFCKRVISFIKNLF